VSPSTWRPLARALALTVGRSAAQRALPAYFAVLVAYSVLLEGSGVRPADVVAGAASSRGQRWLLYGGWLLVSLPAMRALLAAPASFFLRSLPIERWRMLLLQGGALLLAQAPWAYLWLRGGGLGVGLAAVAAALALGALLLTRLERPSEKAAAALLALALQFAPWPALLAVSAPAAVLAVRSVWLRAPQPSPRRARGWIAGPPVLALAVSQLLVLGRQARSQLGRAAVLTVLALAAAYFGVRNLQPASDAERLWLTLALLSPALILTAAGLAGPLLRTEAQLEWLITVCAVSQGQRRAAAAGALVLVCASLALLHTAALALLWHVAAGAAASLCLGAVAAGVLLALLVLGLARWAVRGDGEDAGRLLIGVGCLLVAAEASLLWLHARALLGWAGLAALGALLRAPRSARKNLRAGALLE
jgi:hypothetical protein